MRKVFIGGGRMPDFERQCEANGCRVMLPPAKLGKFCDRHRRQLMTQGWPETSRLDRKLRRLYIDAVLRRLDKTRTREGKRLSRVKPLKLSDHQKREMAGTVDELKRRLASLPSVQEFRHIRWLKDNDEKAQQALAWIVKQRGLDRATTYILANSVGTFICPKLNTMYRYRTTQIANAVLELVSCEWKRWDGSKPVMLKWSGRGWYLKLALVKWLEKTYYLWATSIEESIREELKEETRVRTLELHGVNVEQYDRAVRARDPAVIAAKEQARLNREQARAQAVRYPREDGTCEPCYLYGQAKCEQHG